MGEKCARVLVSFQGCRGIDNGSIFAFCLPLLFDGKPHSTSFQVLGMSQCFGRGARNFSIGSFGPMYVAFEGSLLGHGFLVTLSCPGQLEYSREKVLCAPALPSHFL